MQGTQLRSIIMEFSKLLSYDLCRYFESGGVRVLGCIFNKLPLNGFYNVESCRDAVSSYFRQFRTECKAYGFVPIFETTEETETSASNIVETEFLKVFMDHVDIGSIMLDIFKAQVLLHHFLCGRYCCSFSYLLA